MIGQMFSRFKMRICIFKGTISHLLDLTGWKGPEVLYFGDHPYTDLADVTLEHGWRTGAIIEELSVSVFYLTKVQSPQ
jgi:hypothetical protein